MNMKKIHMVDVVGEYTKHSSVINKKILDVISSGIYIQGPEVHSFEKSLSDYLNSQHVISCGNGTDALYIGLMSLGLEPGDEVIVPSFTFVSTVEVICLLGLIPVFVDIEPDTFLLNSSLIEKNITKKTKAIIPVHLFGQCCDMIGIKLIAKKYNLFIVEDAAQALGSKCRVSKTNKTMRNCGTIGDIGITSFYPSKNLGCYGDGGAIFTQDQNLAHKIRLIVNHGQEKKYVHKIVGLNSRLDSIQAAVLSHKLTFLEQSNNKRKKNASEYDKRLSLITAISTPKTKLSSNHVYHQYSILLSKNLDREKFQNYLLKHNVPSMIYYPIPLHQQEAYKSYYKHELPVSEEVSKHIISLPMHPELDLIQIDFICNVIKQYVKV